MSDQDILEGMSASSSSIRYQTAQPVATASQSVPVRRASRSIVQEPITRVPRRTVEQPRSRRGGTSEPITRATGPRPTQTQATAQLDLDDEQSAQATVPLDLESEQEQDAEMSARMTLLGDDTNADIQVHMPLVPYRRPQPHLRISHQRKHALVFVGLGMIAMLLIWMLGVTAMVGWVNTVSDPRYYTQMAHLDVVMVKIDAHNESQVRAFIDAQGHLDLLIVPTGDMRKAHVVVGPTLSQDFQHVTITVTAQGSVVTILVQGPLEANYLTTTRKTSTWVVDFKQLSKGGH